MNKPSRRAVVRTGVWAVPVVATAAAAPAMATSEGQPPVVITGVAGGCKLPGQPRDKSYAITLNVTNSSPDPQPISITSFAISGGPTTTPSPTDFTVPSGQSTITFVVSGLSSSQRQATATVTYMSNGTVETFSFSIDGFHPFGDTTCPKGIV